MSELRERVARAVTNELARQDGVEGEWDLEEGVLPFIDQGQVDMFAVADAAIAAVLDAMQEPSEGMLAQTGHDDGMNEAPLHDWQAMLAAFRTEALPPAPPEHTLRP